MNIIPAISTLRLMPDTATPSSPSSRAPAAQTAEETTSGGEVVAVLVDAALGMVHTAAAPTWRLRPNPVPLLPDPSGMIRPPSGKGLPPQLPKQPIQSPMALVPEPDVQVIAAAQEPPVTLDALALRWRLQPSPLPLAPDPAGGSVTPGDKDHSPQIPRIPIAPPTIQAPAAATAAASASAPATAAQSQTLSVAITDTTVVPVPVRPTEPQPDSRPQVRARADRLAARSLEEAFGPTVVRSLASPDAIKAAAAPAASVMDGAPPERAAMTESLRLPEHVLRAATSPETAVASASAPVATANAQNASPGATMQGFVSEMVGSEEWAEAVAQRLSQLAESPQARANIRLNPPQLGPMQIEVQVDGDHAIVQLAVHHDATRDALEQAMPKLRAQLEGSGFASIDVSISRNPHRERPGAGQSYIDSSLPPDDDLPAAATGTRPASTARLLDAYA